MCGSLLECFQFGLLNGLRAGGGLGDLLPQRLNSFRVLFDFAFFLIIVVIILNIVFGIIIDTFAQVCAFALSPPLPSDCLLCAPAPPFHPVLLSPSLCSLGGKGVLGQ